MSYSLQKSTTRVLESIHQGYEAFSSQINLQTDKLLQVQQGHRQGVHSIYVTGALLSVGTLQSPRDWQSSYESTNIHPQLEQEIQLFIIESCILDSLSFSAMSNRFQSVERAHARTFDWVYYENQTGPVPWSSFVDWLRHGTGIYWINGKFGSGKSTLMRFLYENGTTRRELATWAGDSPCEVYGFFFWNSGDVDQKSQSGLLRSLLHEILQRHRYLIPIVMPEVWRAWALRAESVVQEGLPYDSTFLPPAPDVLTTKPLKSMFEQVVIRLTETTKLCFLIDGLDEYGGEYAEIVSLLKQSATSPCIKLCLSSRPLPIFKQSFEGLPTLCLQDLTEGDLGHFIRDRLYSHEHMLQLSPGRDTKLTALIQSMVTKAQGVFLWVKLVVRSLVYSLPDCRSVLDLQGRVQHLPSDLEELFGHMLRRTDYQRSSQILQIFHLAHKRAPQKTTLLLLSWADSGDSDLAEDAPIQRISTGEIAMRCQKMDERLQSVCAGLLEASDVHSSSIAPDAKVVYLHRTVSDWLAKPEAREMLVSRTANSGFSASLALFKSYILNLKSMDVTPSRPLDMNIVCEALEYAKGAETDLGVAFPQLLDQLDLAVAYQWRMGSYSGMYEGDDDDDDSDMSDDTEVAAYSDGGTSTFGTPTQLGSYLRSYHSSLIQKDEDVFGFMELETDMPMSQTRSGSVWTGQSCPSRRMRPPAGRLRRSKGEAEPEIFVGRTPVSNGINQLAASYMAHTEASYMGRPRQQQRQPTLRQTPAVRAQTRIGHPDHHWTFGLELPGGLKAKGTVSSFYDVARLAGLTRYAAVKENSANIADLEVSQHMLMRALSASASPSSSSSAMDGGIDAEMVERLLVGGVDPNFAYQGQTPWEAALGAAATYFVLVNDQAGADTRSQLPLTLRHACGAWVKVLEVFLNHGADPYAVVKLQDVASRPIVSVCTVLASYIPSFLDDVAISLQTRLGERRARVDRKMGEREERMGSTKGGNATTSASSAEMLSSTPAIDVPRSWVRRHK